MTDEPIGRDEQSKEGKNHLAELQKSEAALEAKASMSESQLKEISEKLKRNQDALENYLEKAFVHSVDDTTYWMRTWITSVSVASGALAAAMGSTILAGQEFPDSVPILRMALLSLAFSGVAPVALALRSSFASNWFFQRKLNVGDEAASDLPLKRVARWRNMMGLIAAGLVASSLGLLSWCLLLIALHAPEITKLRDEVVASTVDSGDQYSNEVSASAAIDDHPVPAHRDQGNTPPE
ncbi:hypothetical protein [Henriciella litoralis]|uniref:hypothetical protein n=1 Tax=Henriciella litoralis TaxID=568102 RepID=UPI000A05337C|nr:hypothetical protein [Henriciella litoralis]